MRGCLAKLTAELATAAGVERDDILEVTLVGNPVMHHLLLGIDPTELGGAPFALAVDEAVRLPAPRARPARATRARASTSCRASPGHVGADTAGVILAEGPHLRRRGQPVVDVGTNAEIVLGNRDRLLAASSPTGPAFEGAQISCGQRAAPGAIERVRIDPDTLEPRVPVIGCEAWSDEPGFARRAVTGICGSGIVEVVAELHLAGVITTDGHDRRRARGTHADGSSPTGGRSRTCSGDGEPELTITQNDVRQIQLAKAALHAGCRLLMDRYGIERVDRIRLAGAFGTHIDPVHALVLGLVPDCDPARCHLGRQRRRNRRADRAARPRARARRSRTSCGASRRSRPRSSRASRSTSCRRWRSRTTPTPTQRLAAASRCRRRRDGRARRRERVATRRREASRGVGMSRDARRRCGGRAARQAARLHAVRRAASRSSPGR